MRDNHQIDSAEQERLRRLDQYRISRTPPEAAFDDIARLAADLFGAPVAFLCLTEADCHWFKARIGIDVEKIPRSISFCDHTMKGEDVMVVPDASKDPRFAGNPLVTGPQHIRFYAGFTLRDADGFALGTLAVADVVPRQITEQQKDFLKRLASIALDRMELKKVKAALQQTIAATEEARQQAVSGRAELRQVIECLPQAMPSWMKRIISSSGTRTMSGCFLTRPSTLSQGLALRHSFVEPCGVTPSISQWTLLPSRSGSSIGCHSIVSLA